MKKGTGGCWGATVRVLFNLHWRRESVGDRSLDFGYFDWLWCVSCDIRQQNRETKVGASLANWIQTPTGFLRRLVFCHLKINQSLNADYSRSSVFETWTIYYCFYFAYFYLISPLPFSFQWHALSREEQAKYYELARKERQLHMQLYPGWSARDNYVRPFCTPNGSLLSLILSSCYFHVYYVSFSECI